MEEGGPKDSGSFEAQGFEYLVERLGNKLLHKEIRRDRWGRVLSEVTAEIRYAIGSGTQTFSFLVDHDGYLFESPIAWYSKVGAWGLSPGYQADNYHFQRPITSGCLYCHANQVDQIEGTLNRYRPPMFNGHAIGCERCHGPGEQHIKTPSPTANESPNIVNPSHLEPALRDDVCRQCHLQGDERVEPAGMRRSDYRPGLPLYQFESVFSRVSQSNRKRFFGQVEQMNESRCFKESGGSLGCISCHDPHRKPASVEAPTFYRKRCLNCHTEKGCRLPRLERRRDDNCMACHMPRSPNHSIPHTATTDHTIPRSLESKREEIEATPAGIDLVHVDRDRIGPRMSQSLNRDLGIALTLLSRKLPERQARESCRQALSLLDEALNVASEDGPALLARGDALRMLGRTEESLSAFRTALKLAPESEPAVVGAASAAVQLSNREAARAYTTLALAINPWRADYHQLAGVVHVQRQDWQAAVEASKRALELDPANIQARLILVQSYRKMGLKREALEQFGIVLGYNPPDVDSIRRWYGALQ